ncbi:MAG: hypothetical protein IPI53_17655 [Saprospiraceae bacterium]|nr:hypothetical protein [Saprospiraceae bacterium]
MQKRFALVTDEAIAVCTFSALFCRLFFILDKLNVIDRFEDRICRY